MEILNTLLSVCAVIATIATVFYFYKSVYFVVGLLTTRKFKPTENRHKYAVVIAARNEEAVIGNLIDSIHAQDYQAELVTVFVAADNCSDATARIVRDKGCICYERFDSEHRTKGYALQFLFENIRKDYSIEAFDGYFVFDADNLLSRDYITRMNEAFDSGEKIITSYRASKNFDKNWISASYALHWLRTVRTEHRARSVFRFATRIQGTGFLFANEIVKDGWKYTSLTEDRALSADSVVNGYRISYNDDAIFYDEQPENLRIALRQRIRWAKGHLQAFVESGPKLFVNIFRKISFISYDMFLIIFPRSIFLLFRRLVTIAANVGIIVLCGGTFSGVADYLLLYLFSFGKRYLNNMLLPLYVFVTEHRRMPRINVFRKLLFVVTFPLFDLIGNVSMVIALFSHVEWKSIPHTSNVGIDDIEKGKHKKQRVEESKAAYKK